MDARYQRQSAVEPADFLQSGEVERIKQAIREQDEPVLNEYGGLNGTMRRLVSPLKTRKQSRDASSHDPGSSPVQPSVRRRET